MKRRGKGEEKEKLREDSDMTLHGYLFDPEFRPSTRAGEEQQLLCEKKLDFRILKETPN